MSDRFLLRRDRAVQAGAGTGKTYALVTQYLHLLAGLSAHDRPLEPRQIAALTFTDKAAGEMLERLRHRAAALLRAQLEGEGAVLSAEPELCATAAALGRPVPGADHWERLLGQLGGAPVGTFHSFAGSLLRRYPALCRVDPDFVLFDEETAGDLEGEAIERLVLRALEGGLETEEVPVSAEMAAQLVAEYGFRAPSGGEALVELLSRVRRRRAEEGRPPVGLADGYTDEAMARGFDRSRGQLLSGLRRLGELGELLGDKSAVLARELAQAEPRLGAELRDAEDLDRVLPGVEVLLGGLGRLRGKVQDAEGQRVLGEVKAQLRQAHRDLEAVRYTREAQPLARAFEGLSVAAWAAYEEAKARAGGLDFTDLLTRARDLLRDNEEVRAALRERFAVVLVDEFQDTNPLQAELLLHLRGAPAEHRDGPGRLYIVGDRKQSIYEFRGADVATFTDLCQAIRDAGGDEETLQVSRRSLPGVLDFCNALFARVMQPPEAPQWRDPAEPGAAPLSSADSGSLPDLAALQPPGWLVKWDPVRDPLAAVREAQPPPAAELLTPVPVPEGAAEGDAIGREAGLVARHILELNRQGRRLGDMAVLLWRFTHLQRYLLALRQAGVPYYVVKGRGFYEAQEIRDLCAALTLLDDPDDILALVSVLRSPLCGVSDDTLVRLHGKGRLRTPALKGPLPAEVPEGEQERLRRVLGLLAGLRQRGDRLGPAACLRALYDASELPAVLLAGPEGEQRTANLEQLLVRAQRFEEGGGGLRAFVRWLRLLVDPALGGDALAPQAQIALEQDDVVRVMTIHQAKGLEFPVVFLPGCTTRERTDVGAVAYDREIGVGLTLRRLGERHDTLPAKEIQRLRRLRAEAEAARLFYVAVTRARDQVVFAGEGARSKGTWRAHLDGLLESQEAPLLTLREIAQAAPAPPEPAPAPSEEDGAEAAALLQAAQRAVAAIYRPPLVPAAALRLSLSAAADLILDPRRYHLLHVLHLDEQRKDGPARAFAAEEDRDRRDLLRRGTLAHRLLGKADLGLGGTDLEDLLLLDGHEIHNPAVAEIRTRVARLLQSRLFQAETAPRPGRTVRRSLSVWLRGPGALTLTARLDLLVCDEPGRATVLDYHYGYRPGPGGGQPGQLRRALLGHVARALLPPGAEVQVGLVYLREPDPTPQLLPSSPADEEQVLVQLAEAVRGHADRSGRVHS